MYPLKFEPRLKSVIWGGDAICQFKELTDCPASVGESWEVSGVQGDISIVQNGELAGKSLNELLETYKERLVGEDVYERFGTTFPLLIKFIDAREALSIQVHPNDELAKKRHNSFGKTEMWYVIAAEEGAYLYSGFAKKITPEQYEKSLEDDTFTSYLQRHEVKAGDVFFLPAGRVHAIGAGCLIAEIQQTSNVTYRIYDYNRKDAQGNTRELHTELAKDAIDYRVYPEYRKNYKRNSPDKLENLVVCPYFITNLLTKKQGEKYILEAAAVFMIYICIEGKGTITDEHGNVMSFHQGETVFIPAENEHTVFRFEADTKLLETYI